MSGICEHQYCRDVETCPWCELAKAEQERDEARTAAISLLAYLKDTCADTIAAASEVESTWLVVSHACDRFYPWLKEQTDIDESAEETVS